MNRDELEAVIRRQMTRAAASMLQRVDSTRVMNDALAVILDAVDRHAATHATSLIDLASASRKGYQ